MYNILIFYNQVEDCGIYFGLNVTTSMYTFAQSIFLNYYNIVSKKNSFVWHIINFFTNL